MEDTETLQHARDIQTSDAKQKPAPTQQQNRWDRAKRDAEFEDMFDNMPV